jgi:hypothetical protein
MDDEHPMVELRPWTGPIPDGHPDENFLVDVATWSLADPLATLTRLARSLDVPVGALARYVLARWATGGSTDLMEAGPTAITRMRGVVDAAESTGTDEARLAAYHDLVEQLSWLGHGLDDPEATYPDGGG